MTATGVIDNSLVDPAGSFGGTALAGGRAIDPAQWASDEPILGLIREAGYVWGSVRDVETGDLLSVMRRFPPRADDGHDGGRKALAGKLMVQSTRGGAETLQLCREPRDAVLSNDLVREPIEDGVRFAPASTAAGRRMSLELMTERIHYREDDVLDLTGPLACPALQWYLPGRDAALLYLTQTWEVTGTMLGRPGGGSLFWEEAYMPPGGRLYVAKDPLHDVGYTTWYSWANRYADHVVEVGHFLFGQRDFHVGLVASSDGSVRAARRMDAVVSRGPRDGSGGSVTTAPWRPGWLGASRFLRTVIDVYSSMSKILVPFLHGEPSAGRGGPLHLAVRRTEVDRVRG